ncbi:SycD/LcrH family type III secretion system chaperone [Microbulbifer variabilis]|uniref:SycD/LcrH family type III secretion system chaperone n=1 Tax=Microbulbifer variabilis TaxID=266805 RepID=UPI001CFDF36B|nr:SycD/LcrH family type III secretion system chaperone [Microbulbifer variabilis]
MLRKSEVPSLLDEISAKDWNNFLEQGGTLADLLDMTPEELKTIYALAYQKYQNCNYQEALPLFQLLCQCNHMESKYLLGLGATRQALSQFELAAEAYSLAAIVDPFDPRPSFHAAECHLALENWMQAGSGFEMTMLRCEGKPEFETLNQKAMSEFSSVKEKLGIADSTEEKNNDGK